jgi:hypothetical protein
MGKAHAEEVRILEESVLSLHLFLAGTIVWLFNVNISVFPAIIWTVALSAIAYMWIMFLPIFRIISSYYAPRSSTLWFLYTGIRMPSLKFSPPLYLTPIRKESNELNPR